MGKEYLGSMDEYENYKMLAKELFRLKARLAAVEASEARLAKTLAAIGDCLKYGRIVDPTMIRDAMLSRQDGGFQSHE